MKGTHSTISDVHWDLWWFDNPRQYWYRSPVANFFAANTPNLVGHGMADDRVHPELSLQLYNHPSLVVTSSKIFLKIRDITTGLVMYPREPPRTA